MKVSTKAETDTTAPSPPCSLVEKHPLLFKIWEEKIRRSHPEVVGRSVLQGYYQQRHLCGSLHLKARQIPLKNAENMYSSDSATNWYDFLHFLKLQYSVYSNFHNKTP